MKSNFFRIIALALFVVFGFTACDKDDPKPEEKKNIVTLGSQLNTTHKGFFSVSEGKTYNQSEAFDNQAKIDIISFYDISVTDNLTSFGAPGSNIRDIFTGDTAPANWTVKNQTYFTLPTSPITIEEFNALKDGDDAIQTYYNSAQTSGNRMSKNLQVDDIRCFKTASDTYGIYLVLEVVQGENGYIKIEYKTK
jgi:hypothetical protein